MKLSERVKKEKFMMPIFKKGYSRKLAGIWVLRVEKDNKKYANKYTKKELDSVHNRGYLAKSIEKYDLLNNQNCKYITDFEYLFLTPLNNSFSKWIDDIATTNIILGEYSKYSKKIHYIINRRNGSTLFFKPEEVCTRRNWMQDDIIPFIKSKGIVELRSSFWTSKRRRFKIEYIQGRFFVNNKNRTEIEVRNLINSLEVNYIISDYIGLDYNIKGYNVEHYLKLYIENMNKPNVICAVMNILYNENGKRMKKSAIVNLQTGEYEVDGNTLNIRNWHFIKTEVEALSHKLDTLTMFSMSIALTEETFSILHMSANPYLPEIAFNDELNDYLKDLAGNRMEEYSLTMKERKTAIENSLFRKFVNNSKYCRKGIRPYMQRLWFQSLKSDLKYKKTSLKEKIWCWKRGFLSYRIEQYGINESNYKEFMSDYDYHWLNRINGYYLNWINDKTTFRYVLDKYKEYIPEYYYLIYSKKGQKHILKMQDCPGKYANSVEGIISILIDKKKLALKPSAGTHGDGFYCLEYVDNEIHVNGEIMSEEEFKELVMSFKSYYLVTEFVEMSSFLKNIYAKSVNTVRIMVINPRGHNPKIMQTYIRIGSEKTGFTDNVGYGGICAKIDTKSGELYQPETIVDHKFMPCPNHPDTGTPITGKIPGWEKMCDKIIEIARFLPELEYLGFDIAFTEDSFQIIEINIHQDLHKYADLPDEAKEFYRKKINSKKNILGIKEC